MDFYLTLGLHIHIFHILYMKFSYGITYKLKVKAILSPSL